jgi:hypothetical protein
VNDLNHFFSAATGILSRQTLTRQDRYKHVRQLLQNASDALSGAMQEHAKRCDHMDEKNFLFECIMHRFDLLDSSKSSLEKVYSIIAIHPCIAHLQLQLLKDNFRDTLRTRYTESRCFYMSALLTGVYITILPTWFRDETPDMGPTMGRADRTLSMALTFKNQLSF